MKKFVHIILAMVMASIITIAQLRAEMSVSRWYDGISKVSLEGKGFIGSWLYYKIFSYDASATHADGAASVAAATAIDAYNAGIAAGISKDVMNLAGAFKTDRNALAQAYAKLYNDIQNSKIPVGPDGPNLKKSLPGLSWPAPSIVLNPLITFDEKNSCLQFNSPTNLVVFAKQAGGGCRACGGCIAPSRAL